MKNPTSWICILHLQQLIFFQNDEDLKRQATHQNKMFNPIKKEMLQKKL